MPFDISSVLADLGKNGAADRQQIEYIELHLIDKNPKNLYSIEGIDSLADNIRIVGLLEPLLVKRTEAGRYMLISGHRRREALRRLADDGSFPDGMHHKVPCIVSMAADQVPGIEDPEKSAQAGAVIEELKLLFANADTRVLSSSDTAMQVRETKALLTRLKTLGYPMPGKLRDYIAEAAGISASRVARLDVIEKGLKAPELRKAWEDGKLSETSAYEIARRDEESQALLLKRCGVGLLCASKTADVVRYLDVCETDLNLKRNRAVAPPVSGADTADNTDKDSADYAGDMDDAETGGDAEPAGEEAATGASDGVLPYSATDYIAQSKMEDDILRDICFRNLPDILGCIMAHKDHNFLWDFRQANIDAMKRHGLTWCPGWNGHGEYLDWTSKGVRVQKRIDNGGGKTEWVRFKRSWTDLYDALCGAALESSRKKKKSAGTGVTNMTDPSWSTGTPDRSGLYVVKCGIPAEDGPQWRCRKVVVWTGDAWVTTGPGVPLKENVYGWYRIPED